MHPGSSFGAGVLGDGFGALGDGVFGQLPGQQQPDRSLHLSAGDGGPLVVLGQPGRLRGDPLKQVVHEGVHDAHGSAGNPRIRMNLGDGTRYFTSSRQNRRAVPHLPVSELYRCTWRTSPFF